MYTLGSAQPQYVLKQLIMRVSKSAVAQSFKGIYHAEPRLL